MAVKTLKIDMNRVEGDLQMKLEVDDGVITDAWTVGTMYRGFEQLLMGRAKMDGLVITPRICGICGTAHQYAAVAALETAFQCPIAPNGTRVRNVCLMAEEIQSDARHAFLMFTIDLCNKRYESHPLYPAIMEHFEPFRGRTYRETVVQTKKLLEIVAMFGGQWPHSSYMIPGGVVGMSNRRNLVKSIAIIDVYTKWYERSILGCSLERWSEISSLTDLLAWVDEKPEHRDSPVGLFIRFTRDVGLQNLGRGNGNMLSSGVYFDPVLWQPPFSEQRCLRRAGFYNAETDEVETFSHRAVTEHVKYSWYRDYDGGAHPWEGETVPTYDPASDKYSWAKSPRYKDKVTEVGCLAELFVAGDPLANSLFREEGANVWTRQLSRFHRPTISLQQIRAMLFELEQNFEDPYYERPTSTDDGDGAGLIHAARGSLGHWVRIRDGKIAKYQVITPTGWNASSRDSEGRRGHWEQSVIGTEIRDEENPVELGHIIRSHDACLVCTVHFVRSGRAVRYDV